MIIEHPSSADLVLAAQLLKDGKLVAFPTETVYGLGADAENEQAVKLIFDAKGRPKDHPLIVHLPDMDAAEHFACNIPDYAYALMKQFWPGALTLILQKRPGVANASSGHQNTLGLRIPSHPMALELLVMAKSLGVMGVAAPSANRFGRVSPTQAFHVAEELGDDLLILNGGASQIGIESTIIDCSRGEPILLRPGQLSIDRMEHALNLKIHQQLIDGNLDTSMSTRFNTPAPKVSGRMLAHYAPKAKVLLRERKALEEDLSSCSPLSKERIAVWSTTPLVLDPQRFLYQAMPSQAEDCAHVLFSTLRDFDKAGVDQIWIEQPPCTEEWQGINDRLKRASHAQ